MRRDLPSGTVTFLFTDVEGSTRLLDSLGASAYAEALATHRRILREAFGAHGGVEVDTQGDAFFVAFPTAPGALEAAEAALGGLAAGPILVRMGIHTGTSHVAEEGYVGADVHRAARIAACGHGGQVLVSASTAALLDRGRLHDLGEHRLKDLSAPERLYQLGAEVFPPLRSLHQTNLPVPATPFLGRDKELSEVLLLAQGARLLTLTGPGGTGKTRLALEAARALADRYSQGVWWVPLAPLRDSELVLATAAQALGAKEALAEHIADDSLLLLLDNFEHVVEAAADVAALLVSCPNLDLLVTSREPLHVTGEQEYTVPPLAPDEGIEFFLTRARTVRPDFEDDGAVPEICRRLDALPLALELAAARVKALSPAQMLDRLEQRLPLLTGGARDLPEHQRTLRATIEWSHELLTAEEQGLFARLAVFTGGCAFAAAEEIAEADLDTLQSLVDKSLLRHNEERFWMLETVREYAAERLEESGDAEVLRLRHAEYFLAFAEKADVSRGQNLGQELDLLETDHDNLRVALDTFERAGETARTIQLTAALGQFWFIRGHSGDAGKRLPAALEADARPSIARATVLRSAAIHALDGGDLDGSQHLANEAIATSRELGDRSGEARGLVFLAQSFADRGEPGHAAALAADSAAVFEQLGDDVLHRQAMHEVGWMSFVAGDVERSRSVHERNLERARAADDRRLAAASLELLALIAAREGRSDDARAMLRESFTINRALGYSFGIAYDLDYLGATAIAVGSPELAARLLSRAEALRAELGAHIRGADSVINDQTLRAIRSELDDETLSAAWEAGRTAGLDELVDLALAAEDSRPTR